MSQIISANTGGGGGGVTSINTLTGAITLAAGSNISLTPAGNTITIASTAGGLTWSREAATPVPIVVNHGYIPTGGALTTFTLPATAVLGDVIEIVGESGWNWTIAQNALQQIQFGNIATTVGVAGSMSSTNAYDSVRMVCRVAGASTRWQVVSAVGILNLI
jgi:hypothetical protein